MVHTQVVRNECTDFFTWLSRVLHEKQGADVRKQGADVRKQGADVCKQGADVSRLAARQFTENRNELPPTSAEFR